MANQQELERIFMKAAQDEDLETVRSLVEGKKVNVNATDWHGWTALIYASDRGHKEVVKLLLDKDANVNAADNYGGTALIFASMKGQKAIVEMLLDEDANVNHADKCGWTALIWASCNGQKEIIKMLMDKNAGTNMANDLGKTALDYAKQCSHYEIVVLILNYEIAKLEDKLDRGMSPQDTKTKNQELLEKAQLRKQHKTTLKREKESPSDSSRPQKRSRRCQRQIKAS